MNDPDLSAKLGHQARALSEKSIRRRLMQSACQSFSAFKKGIFSMRKVYDVPQTPPDNPEVEYYKELARLSEERARETRRIAALERARLRRPFLNRSPL
jgi:hypothetical protein